MAVLSTSQEPCREEDAEALRANESMLYMPGSDQQIPVLYVLVSFLLAQKDH
jgi:hypothetical protein